MAAKTKRRSKKHQKTHVHHAHNVKFLIALTIIVILIVAGFLFLHISKTQVKSHIIEVENHREINKEFSSNSKLDLNLDKPPKALKLNGKIYGEGKVRVYMKSNGKKFLIFDSEPLREHLKEIENNRDAGDNEDRAGSNVEIIPLAEAVMNGGVNINASKSEENVTIIELENVCFESCNTKGANESTELIIEVENATIVIEDITYIVEEENHPPAWFGKKTFSLKSVETIALNLDEKFEDLDGDKLNYTVGSEDPIISALDENLLELWLNKSSTKRSGIANIKVIASDSKEITKVKLKITYFTEEEITLAKAPRKYKRAKNKKKSEVKANSAATPTIDILSTTETPVDKLSHYLVGENKIAFLESKAIPSRDSILDKKTILGEDSQIIDITSIKKEGDDLDVDVEIKTKKLIIEMKREPIIKMRRRLQRTGIKSYIIENEAEVEEEEIDREQRELEEKIRQRKGKIKNRYKRVFNGIAIEIPEEEVDDIKRLPNVKAVHPDKKVQIVLDKSVPLIKADKVWLENVAGEKITGKGMKIAVIDTGVDYTHGDLGGCLGPGCKVIGGYDFANSDTDPMDDHGHGTHVAATAAGDGILKGVAPDANVLAYKVLSSSGYGTFSNVIAGIEKAVEDGADIISMSLGGGGDPDDAPSQAVDNAVDAGVIVVVAAGNSGSAKKTIVSPGTARKAITIGATDKNDVIAYFSSRGPNPTLEIKPEVTAPGVDICAAQHDQWYEGVKECSPELDGHIAISGTSMATPHVSGAVALLKQAHPNWNPKQIKSVLISTAKDLNYDVNTQGGGRINVLDAYNAKIATHPSIFNIGRISKTKSYDFVVENLKNQTVSLEFSLSLVSDGQNEYGDMINLSDYSLELYAFENSTVTLNIDTQERLGNFEGYVKITTGTYIYTIPFYFVDDNKLTVYFKDEAGGRINPSFAVLHNEDFSFREYTNDITNGITEFSVPGTGNYYIQAIGDRNNYSLNYILSKKTDIVEDSEITVSLSDATKHVIPARDNKDNLLDLYDFEYMIKLENSQGSQSMSRGFIGFGFHGDRIVYVPNLRYENITRWLGFQYYGVPNRGNKRLQNGYEHDLGWRSETLNAADELYLRGWEFDNNAIIEFKYSPKDFGEYTYNYNYPADVSHNAFDNVLFWLHPGNFFGISAWNRMAASNIRKTYVQANEWRHQNYMYISYFNSTIRNENFAAAFGAREDYKTRFSWPAGYKGIAGEKKSIYFGTAPYILPYFENSRGNVKLRERIMHVFNNNSYIQIYPKVFWASSDGTSGTINLTQPHVEVYDADKNILLYEEDIIQWRDFSYSNNAVARFRLELEADPDYNMYNTTISATFANGENPPYLEIINISPRFKNNEVLAFSFQVSTENEIKDISAFYHRGSSISSTGITNIEIAAQDKWKKLKLGKESYTYLYSAQLTPKDLDELNLRIEITDTNNNSISYKVIPIALKAKETDLIASASNTNPYIGESVKISGYCKDEFNVPCKNFKLSYYFNEEPVGYSRTKSDGYFEHNHVFRGAGTFSIVFRGSGIYFPKTKTISLGEVRDTTPPSITNLQKSPLHVYNDVDVEVSATITDDFGIDTVILKHNASGEWKEYRDVVKSGDTYKYTLKKGLLENQEIIRWRFQADDLSGNIADGEIQTFKVENRKPVLLEKIRNIDAYEYDLIKVKVSAIDYDRDELTYTFSSPLNSSGEWQTGPGDEGVYNAHINITDGISLVKEDFIIIIKPARDLDEDGIPDALDDDDDNDGIPDNEDHLIGSWRDIISRSTRINISIDDDNDLRKRFMGRKRVIFKDMLRRVHKKILEFDFNFSSMRKLDLGRIKVEKQWEDEAQGGALVKGLSLEAGYTKTIYVDNLNPAINSVCIYDAEIDDLSEISSGCNGSDEHLIICNGIAQGNYTCVEEDERYKVSGLSYSGVREQCVDNDGDGFYIGCTPTDCDDTDSGINSNSEDVCGNGIDEDCDGSDATCPEETPQTPPSGGGGGGGGGGSGVSRPTTSPLPKVEEDAGKEKIEETTKEETKKEIKEVGPADEKQGEEFIKQAESIKERTRLLKKELTIITIIIAVIVAFLILALIYIIRKRKKERERRKRL